MADFRFYDPFRPRSAFYGNQTAGAGNELNVSEFLQPTENIKVFWGFRICPENGIIDNPKPETVVPGWSAG